MFERQRLELQLIDYIIFTLIRQKTPLFLIDSNQYCSQNRTIYILDNNTINAYYKDIHQQFVNSKRKIRNNVLCAFENIINSS